MKSVLPCFLYAVLLATVAASPATVALTGSAEDNAGIGINQTTVLVFPYEMLLRGLSTGEARVVISVDAAGRLTDSLVIGYTDPVFAEAASAALKKWSYEPAHVHGQARASRADVLFTYRNDIGVMVQSYSEQGMEKRLNPTLQEHYVFRTWQLRDLDRIPTPLQVVPPVISKGSPSHGTKRTVTVEFYIDETGKVRMPTVEREEPDDAYAAAAVAAVEQWQFEPPLHKGRPVLVLARQDFAYVPKP